MSHPVDPHARWVLIFRWAVFLLAAFFVLRQLVIVGDYGHAGGPFRYLTIWALLLSFFSASRMLALTERRSDKTWPRLVMVTAVANGLTVLMYWRLWLQDPALVVAGDPLPLWVDYYLHGVGPLLQWIDVLFVRKLFEKARSTSLSDLKRVRSLGALSLPGPSSLREIASKSSACRRAARISQKSASSPL